MVAPAQAISCYSCMTDGDSCDSDQTCNGAIQCVKMLGSFVSKARLFALIVETPQAKIRTINALPSTTASTSASAVNVARLAR